MNNQELATRFKRYFDLLAQESDRGSVIVGAAVLEDLLDQVVVARLCPALEKEDELLAGASAPCGTFAAKIDLAYRIGAMGLVMRSSLHLIRKMRNDAAHAGDQRSLDTPQLQQRLRELLRLNDDLLGAIWETIKDTDSMRKHIKIAGTATHDFVSTLGWRGSWNMLTAVLAAGLSFSPEGQSRLTAREVTPSKKEQSA